MATRHRWAQYHAGQAELYRRGSNARGFVFPMEGDPPEAVANHWPSDGRNKDPKDPSRNFTSTTWRSFPAGGCAVEAGCAQWSSAHEEMNLIARGLAAAISGHQQKIYRGHGHHVRTRTSGGQEAHAMVILLVSVAVVLLIACMNVANLLLVRASGRNRKLRCVPRWAQSASAWCARCLRRAWCLPGRRHHRESLAMWALKIFIT